MSRGWFLMAGILGIAVFLVALVLKTGNFVGAGLIGFYIFLMLIVSPVIFGRLNGGE